MNPFSRRLDPVLRPRAFRRLPVELWPENVDRLASRLEGGLADPGFHQLLHRIDEGPLHPVTRVEVFTNGERAFEAARQAIAGARAEVLLESYIMKDDATGRRMFGWLTEAAARGVRVRVLADAFGSFGTRRAFWKEMEASGIAVRLFHPLARFWLQFFRDHRKMIVVDRKTAITGGMNVANEYGSSRHARGGLWRDTDVLVEGSTAWEMAVVFSEAWNRATPPFRNRATSEDRFMPESLVLEKEEDSSRGRVLILDSRPGRGHIETASVLSAIVGAARRYVWITMAYFAPRMRAVSILARAVERGVDVRLLLPGVSDVPLARHAGHSYFPRLLASGVRVFEYQPATLHAKTMVADDLVAVVGSSNLDFLSFNNNAECNLVIMEDSATRALTAAFREDLGRSVEITKDTWKRSVIHRVGDTLAGCLRPIL